MAAPIRCYYAEYGERGQLPLHDDPHAYAGLKLPTEKNPGIKCAFAAVQSYEIDNSTASLLFARTLRVTDVEAHLEIAHQFGGYCSFVDRVDS